MGRRGLVNPDFASALCIEWRTGAIDAKRSCAAQEPFERLVAADLRLACAEITSAKQMAPLGAVLAGHVRRLRIEAVRLLSVG
jgi:hypothetical protein